jgi:hypothetical protein
VKISGHELYDIDVDGLNAPYAPSVAKPFHVVWAHYEANSNTTFYATIIGEPAEFSAKCLLGREGFNDSDWMVTVDNSGDDCAAKMQTVNVLAIANTHRVSTHSLLSTHWLMLISVMAIAVLFTVWSRCSRSTKSMVDTEIQPLLF